MNRPPPSLLPIATRYPFSTSSTRPDPGNQNPKSDPTSDPNPTSLASMIQTDLRNGFNVLRTDVVGTEQRIVKEIKQRTWLRWILE
ncbi:hypothetical protein SGCOL_002228 [Colletotrichum sp. CLE4]